MVLAEVAKTWYNISVKQDQKQITEKLKQQIQDMLPSGVEIYNALMQDIEPDLVSTAIEQLDEKYANETESDRNDRVQRYAKAVTKYDAVAKIFFTKLDAEVDAHREKVEMQSAELEKDSLDSLEDQFSSDS